MKFESDRQDDVMIAEVPEQSRVLCPDFYFDCSKDILQTQH